MLFENIVLGALFFILVPGILVSLPRGGSKMMVAFVHAIVFVLAYMVLQYVANYGGYDYAVYEGYEGYEYEDEDEDEDEYEDEEGFQMKKVVKPMPPKPMPPKPMPMRKKTGGIISPQEQLRKDLAYAQSACDVYSRNKGAKTKGMANKYCNMANEIRNKLNNLEVKEGFYIFGNFFRRWFR